MGDLHVPSAALLVVAAFSRHEQALSWAQEHLQSYFGPLALAATPFAFHHTKYYEKTMGANLSKQLLAFEQLVPLAQLTEIKLRTNLLEAEVASTGRFPETRPLNLDPGLLTLGKFMLATTKDQAHRIYLGEGIFAEVTLRFESGQFEPWPWTYADYREPEVRASLKGFRDLLKQRLAVHQG
jgi:hypothetical protein